MGWPSGKRAMGMGAVLVLGLWFAPGCDPGPVEPDARLAALEATLLSRSLNLVVERDARPGDLVPVGAPAVAEVDPVEAARQRAAEIFARIDGHYIVGLDRRALALEGIHDSLVYAERQGLKPVRHYNHALVGFTARLDDQQFERPRRDPRVRHLHPDSVVFSQDRPMERGTDRVDADLNPHSNIDFEF